MTTSLCVQQPTCAVEHGEQYRRDPCSVTVSHPKLPDQLLEKNADCFGKGIGEARDDKTACKHGPAPAPIWSLHSAWIHVQRFTSHRALGCV